MDMAIVGRLLNLLCSAATVGLATYVTAHSLEGAIVAALGAAVNHLRETPITTPVPVPLPGQKLAFLLPLLLLFPLMGSAKAMETLEWDRNTEADMSHYNAYYCLTKGCVVSKTSEKSKNIPHPPLASLPSFVLPKGEGTIAVTASDTSGNESGLSVSVPFDTIPPQVPSHARGK